MEKQIKTMRDSNGHDVPVKYVAAYDKARDKATRKILARFLKARAFLEEVVSESIKELDELKGGKEKLGEKGNFSAQSFDGLISVEIRQQYNILLDERVIRARELMLDYVNRSLDKVRSADMSGIKLIVQEAFKANSRGFLPTSKIFTLMRMEIADKGWREAKEILQAAIKPTKGKQYLTCSTRKSTQGDFKSIRLDIADCWPEHEEAPEA